MKQFKTIAIQCLPLIVFLIFWQWITQGSKKLLFLFSSPEQIWHKALAEYQSSTIWNDIWVTSLETILGLSIGTLLGLIVGLLMWGNGQFEKIAKPYIILLGSIPVFALAPMLIIWFGIGLLSKVVMALRHDFIRLRRWHYDTTLSGRAGL